MVEVIDMDRGVQTEELEKEALLNARVKFLGGKPQYFTKRGKELFLEKKRDIHPLAVGISAIRARLRRNNARSIKIARATKR